MDGQISMFDLDLVSGRTCPALSPAGGTPKQEKSGQAKTSGSSSSRFSKLKNHTFMLLDLRPGAGNMLGPYWEYDPVWPGSFGTLNTSECPSDVVVSFLWQILQAIVPSRYCLSNKACRGILRRSEERGKPLPEDLERVLRIQSKLILPDGVGAKPGSHHINQRNEGLGTQPKAPTEWLAFTANQRDEVRDLHGVSAALCAEPGMKQQTFVAGFSAGAGATAGSIGYAEECAPTLKGSAGGSCMPSVLCLNDQGGKIMDCTEDISGTLRAEEHGHQPLILSIQQSEAETETDRSTTAIEMTNMCGGNQPSMFENHGIDARYRGPLSVAPTLPARAGTGGNNLSLVAQPVTSQVYCRQRVDVFQNGEISSTESARQYKDATDLVCQIPADGSPLQDALAAGVRALIRRLTPLECERLQGFPDGWTDIPGASDSARYRALGNSVAIPCVEYLIRRIVIVLLLGFRGFL
jgi:hypothetical protein